MPKKLINPAVKPQPIAPVKHEWSEYQKAIFRELNMGEGNLIISARAGAAKTTSLVEGSKYIPKGKTALFCAFNKSIQEELKKKLNSKIECMTLHSLGYRAVRLRFGNVELNDYKCHNIVENIISEPKKNYDLIKNICETVRFCKLNMVDTPANIEKIITKYDIDLCEVELKQFISHVCLAMRRCKEQTNVIDFTDMLWMPFVYNLPVGSYDFVLIDESHDISKIMVELALSAVKKDGRVVAVLDDKQNIYSFAGADETVYDNLKSRLNPKELFLPICYRCPSSIIKLAQTLVPDIQVAPNAIEGEIHHIHTSEIIKLAKPGSYVISRYNAPLIKSCMMFLKNQIPANILGRDIGDGLSHIIKKSKKKKVKELLEWLNKWEATEKENLLAKYPHASTESIADRADCIRMLSESATSIDEVKTNIKNLFKDGDEAHIVLHSSIHRVKGKEQNDVFVLADTLQNFDQTEINIKYISYTRAKKRLFLASKNNAISKL